MSNQNGGGIPTTNQHNSPQTARQQKQQQQYTTFEELEGLTFSSAEPLIAAARSIAALSSISLTITHKSRNTPGMPSAQYRGCVVMVCTADPDCSFEWKGYGPIEGGWKMRPLQLPTLKKHTVTSWCVCNHSKVPMRQPQVPLINTWEELLKARFAYPDDFIECATRVANLQNVSVYLLALNLSDNQPKSNGREGVMYVPRGFLTLSCIESENGCPFEIKAREEEDGWAMRPWREKGKEIKGAVSHLTCTHSQAAKEQYQSRRFKKKTKRTKNDQDQSPEPQQLHPHQPPPQQHHHHEEYDPTFNSALSTSQILGQIEGYQNLANSSHHYQPIASTSAAILPHSFDQFRNSLAPYTTSPGTGMMGPLAPNPHPQPSPQPHHSPSTSNANGKRTVNGGDLNVLDKPAKKRSRASGGPTLASLKATWKKFLLALDPQGRLNVLETPLAEGGIDPRAVLDWPAEDLKDFVETVAAGSPPGIRIHFRVLFVQDGHRAWDEISR